ncbi:MAG: hypothetical protein MJ051_02885 [Akkermansia sp.]|nr:hypothetical protein [Akkermansia sp.]
MIPDHYSPERNPEVPFGPEDTFTLTHAAKVNIELKVDDFGTLYVEPVPGSNNATPAFSVEAELQEGDWGIKQQPDRWQHSVPKDMQPGTYRLRGSLYNKESGAGSYIYFAVRITELSPIPPKPTPKTCPAKSKCSQGSGGDEDLFLLPELLIGSGKDKCPDSAELSAASGNGMGRAMSADPRTGETAVPLAMSLRSIRNHTATLTETAVCIDIGEEEPLTFALTPGSADAAPTGHTLNSGSRVQLQGADGTPCPAGGETPPARLLLAESNGRRLLFAAESGRLLAVIAADDSVQNMEEQGTVTCYDAEGYLSAVYSAEAGLQRFTRCADGTLLTEWFAAADVAPLPEGGFETTAPPYQSAEYRRTRRADGLETTIITRQQADLPATTTVRREREGYVAVTRGSGAEAVTRVYETYDFTGDTTGTIESVYAGEPAADGSTEALTVLSRTLSVNRMDAGGPMLLRRTTDFGGENEQTTYYSYDSATSRLARINRPDGSYTRYAYDALGRTTLEASPTADGGEEITETSYHSGESARFADPRPAVITTTHNGVLIRREVHEYTDSPAVNSERITTTAAGALQARTRYTEYYGASPDYPYAAGKLKHTTDESGAQTDYVYTPTAEHGAAHKLTITTCGADGALVAGHSRRTERYIAADDTTTFEQESIWSGSQWLLLSTVAHEYDAQQRLIRSTQGNGRRRETAWMCCGKLSETDENGIRTDYAYNSAQQLIEESRSAVYHGDTCITPESITEYERDAQGRTVGITRRIGAMTSVERTEYDGLGRVVAQTDALGRRRTTAYSADGLSITQTAPSGAESTTTRHKDGRSASLSGSAQRAVQYSYDMTPNHCRRTTVSTAAGTLLSQTVEDGFGRTIEESVPSPAGNLITTRSEYNERGQLIRRTRTDGSTEQAPTLYEYDRAGRLSRQITALSGEPTPENSVIVEYAYTAEPADGGLVYAVTRTTRYNAAGEALISIQKDLISALDPAVESEHISTDERGHETRRRTEYAGGSARLTLSEQPGCAAPARSLSIDGFTLEQTDAAGVTSRATRRYTENGMELTQTDGRGNTTTQVSDIAGRTLRLTDAAGATTTTTYAADSDHPAAVTDALGNTACYRYDERGRKVAEWGTAIQPALYAYDDADRLTSLTTFRDAPATNADGSPSQSATGAAAGDTTSWTYDEATGQELAKRYADGSTIAKTYDSFGNLATETNARGQVACYTYDSFRNLLLTVTYSDGTTPEQYSYNHLGWLTAVSDSAGTRSITYNRYGEVETDSLHAGGMMHTITEQRDALGRSAGYIYAKNGIPQQQTTVGYGADGRVASAGFMHGGVMHHFGYSYVPGTHLLYSLTHPNGLTLTQSYDTARDLPAQMDYTRGAEQALIVRRSYTYDLLGRPAARNLARYGTQTSDTFGYNTRSELTSAHVNNADYAYAYDAIGNRTAATEAGARTEYSANNLNQYTAESSFCPEFDADGNQTLIRTSTGIWNVTYNAKNRPVRFEKADGSIVVECTYDTMGRRATKKVTTNGTLTEHRRYLYRGYLQISCCDLTRTETPALWHILWDPTQETATRPLAIQKNGTWYTYGWDLTKNICETYRTDGRIDLAYTYTPYGEVTPAHAYDQPIRWSSEYHDVELGLVYYNYRHYNPSSGRWTGRDAIPRPFLYDYAWNNPLQFHDYLGLLNLSQNQPAVPTAPTAPTVVMLPSAKTDVDCSICESKLPDIRDYIRNTYKINNGNKCIIRLACEDPNTWDNKNMGAYFAKYVDNSKNGYRGGKIALACGACSENVSRKHSGGAISLYGFTDYAKHEALHAINNCNGIENDTIDETQAYALFSVVRGEASRRAYTNLLRGYVKWSVNNRKAEFSEELFIKTLEELGKI